MKPKNPLSRVTSRVSPTRRKQIENAVKVTAGTAATVWMVLRLKRELYGPGGSKMSRYRTTVDKIWPHE
jgi:hypothetical protein